MLVFLSLCLSPQGPGLLTTAALAWDQLLNIPHIGCQKLETLLITCVVSMDTLHRGLLINVSHDTPFE